MHTSFADVQIHHDRSAQDVNATAYTVGRHVVFAPGQYAPDTGTGRRLLAHELTHVIQQRNHAGQGHTPLILGRIDDPAEREAALTAETITAGGVPPSPTSHPRGTVRRDTPQTTNQADAGVPVGTTPNAPTAPGKTAATASSPAAAACAINPDCPPSFCVPFPSKAAALADRDTTRLGASWADVILAGIATMVNTKVVPIWREYIFGGSSVKNLTPTFATDFTASRTTNKTTDFLASELQASLAATPPAIAAGSAITVNLATRIAPAIAELDDPSSAKRMNFDAPKEIPGNLAGDIGKDEKACPVGAKPSPLNDSRSASGTAIVTSDTVGNLTANLKATYHVEDTVDLCPGNCGTSAEQIATVPLSRWEASGISGDVPFTIDFPAPPRTINIPKVAPAPPAGKAPATAPTKKADR